MKTALLMVLLLWQAEAVKPGIGDFRFRRPVEVRAGAEARACAVLDGNVYAHSRQGLDDVRLFSADGAAVPYALTSSGAMQAGSDEAEVLNAGVKRGHVVFDLEMPARAYSGVTLKLNGADYVGTATVTGLKAVNEQGGTALGTFTVFDLSGQGLGANSTLALQEVSFPYLHVDLQVDGVAGKPAPVVTVSGAEIPPSREAQELYTVLAQTGTIEQRGREQVAVFDVPARVPVERVSLVMAGGDKTNFSRAVQVRARAVGEDPRAGEEEIGGEVSRVRLTVGGKAIKQEDLSVPATIGANAQVGARVEVAVENGDDKPLAIEAVRLEMRERKICFNAPAGSVTMAYGDDGLASPVYDYSRLFNAGDAARVATLGPEQVFAGRVERKSLTERHPELLWVALLGMVGVLGLVAFRSAKKV